MRRSLAGERVWNMSSMVRAAPPLELSSRVLTKIFASRLDLRPGQGASEATAGDETTEVPPLGVEGNEASGDSSNSARRRSRFFDLARLRQAPVEERIEVLRRMRTEQRQRSSANSQEESTGRARLSNRLRDRLGIRTRAAHQRSSERTGSSSSEPRLEGRRGAS